MAGAILRVAANSLFRIFHFFHWSVATERILCVFNLFAGLLAVNQAV